MSDIDYEAGLNALFEQNPAAVIAEISYATQRLAMNEAAQQAQEAEVEQGHWDAQVNHAGMTAIHSLRQKYGHEWDANEDGVAEFIRNNPTFIPETEKIDPAALESRAEHAVRILKAEGKWSTEDPKDKADWKRIHDSGRKDYAGLVSRPRPE
jgi:hypothetical protein